MAYIKPTVVDYGDLQDMTAAAVIGGPEDGASKNIEQHHSIGLLP